MKIKRQAKKLLLVMMGTLMTAQPLQALDCNWPLAVAGFVATYTAGFFGYFYYDVKRNALRNAVIYADLEHIKTLIKQGFNVHTLDHAGYSALHYAAQCGHWEIVRYLVEEHNVDIDIKSGNGETALILAARPSGNRLKIISYLINAGANINAADIYGYTALHTVFFNFLPTSDKKTLQLMVKYLVDNGINVFAVNNYNATALEMTQHYGRDCTSCLSKAMHYYTNGTIADAPDTNSLLLPNYVALDLFKEDRRAFQQHADLARSDSSLYNTLFKRAKALQLRTGELMLYDALLKSTQSNKAL